MDNMMFSLQATMPVFLVIVVGCFLGQIGFLNREFCKCADRLAFRVALPSMLFLDMSALNLRQELPVRFVGFCALFTLTAVLGIWGATKLLLPDKTLVGEFTQASYRSSAAVLGIALVQNMYGNSGMVPIMILGSVPLYNIFAVIILSLESPEEHGKKIDYIKLGKNLVTNPILIGIFLGTIYGLLPFGLPVIAQKTLQSLAALTTPISLLSIGAAFEGAKAVKKLLPTVSATFIKLVGLSLVGVPLAIWLGFRGQEVIAILIMLGSPLTPSSYVMSKNMGHEGVLTASVIAASTLLASVTLTVWIFVLKSGGFIV